MKFQPEIKIVSAKILTAKRIRMSLAANRTGELWKDFMINRKKITNNVGPDLISMSEYDADHFKSFQPSKEFWKYAAAEVKNHDQIPEGFEAFQIPGGLYAVFHYKGPNTDFSIFEYIFREWLPSSGYELDQRPHFEVMGEKYKNGDPASEEDIFIPVKKA
jgi:AraC family transcriptional regulator